MTEKDLEEFLVGKTIVGVETDSYMGWLVLEALVFSDGSRVELGGNADVAYVCEAVSSDGTVLYQGG